MSDPGVDTGARPWHGAGSPFEALYQWLVGAGVIPHYQVPAEVETAANEAVAVASDVLGVVEGDAAPEPSAPAP